MCSGIFFIWSQTPTLFFKRRMAGKRVSQRQDFGQKLHFTSAHAVSNSYQTFPQLASPQKRRRPALEIDYFFCCCCLRLKDNSIVKEFNFTLATNGCSFSL